MNVTKYSILKMDLIGTVSTTLVTTRISVVFAEKVTITVTISSYIRGATRVKGIRAIIVVKYSKLFRLNNITNLSTLGCIDLPAPGVAKDSTIKVNMKNTLQTIERRRLIFNQYHEFVLLFYC